MPILPFLLAALIFAAAFYFGGQFIGHNIQGVADWIRRRWGVLLAVFGTALLLTKNPGVAAAATVAFMLLARSGAFSPGGGGDSAASRPLSLEEAYLMLGLKPGATRDEVQAAYRGLMKRNHPDQGGSSYIASRLNEAKDMLLKNIAA